VAGCSKLGANLATLDQVKSAYAAGAEWCSWGYTATDAPGGAWVALPMQSARPGWSTAPGLRTCISGDRSCTGGILGAICFGVKPARGAVNYVTIAPFYGPDNVWNAAGERPHLAVSHGGVDACALSFLAKGTVVRGSLTGGRQHEPPANNVSPPAWHTGAQPSSVVQLSTLFSYFVSRWVDWVGLGGRVCGGRAGGFVGRCTLPARVLAGSALAA
jgi:hypothetical protein